jgi:small subunit ribosomal protein S21
MYAERLGAEGRSKSHWTGIIGVEARNFGRFGGGISLAEVRVQEGEPLENALRRFKRKVQQEDIIKEVKRHSYYLKPGEKRASRQLWRASGIARRLVKSRLVQSTIRDMRPRRLPRKKAGD